VWAQWARAQGPQHHPKTHHQIRGRGGNAGILGFEIAIISNVPFLTQMWRFSMTAVWQWQLTALGNGGLL